MGQIAVQPERPALDNAGIYTAARARIVITLLVGVVLMSLGDLYMTLTYATRVGMIEANPIARFIMGYNSPALVIAFKVLTLGVGVGIIFRYRRSTYAFYAACICFGVLCWLTFRWVEYNAYADELNNYIHILAENHKEARWVHMTGTR